MRFFSIFKYALWSFMFWSSIIFVIADCPSDNFWGCNQLDWDNDLDWLIRAGMVDLYPFSSSIFWSMYVRLDCYDESWSLASSSSVMGPSTPRALCEVDLIDVVVFRLSLTSDLASNLTLARIYLALFVNCVYLAATGCLGGSFLKGSICFKLKDFMMWSCKAAEFNAA